MAQLEIFLLGMPQIRVDGGTFTKLASRKARALLFYLALTKQQHARQTLAGLFWGEMSEANARRNLRVTLTKLKSAFGEFLFVRRRTLAINPDADVWIDVNEFETCLAPAEPTLAQLQCAAELYGGHFLDGFYLRDAPMFEDWVRPLQERYRQMAMETLYRLAVYHTQQKQYGTGIDYASRLLTLEPWLEEAHRQMMRLQALSGQRSAALAQFDTCRAMLAEELGVEPTEATISLYEQIRDEKIGEDLAETAVSFPTPILDTPFQCPPQSPHFVGRLTLLSDLSATLTSAKSQQIHALVGMGGIGKSTVAVQLAHLLRDSFADGVLWAQAATAEPMAILESWAQAYGYDFTRIGDVESMAAAFRSALTDKSVLIVLDDVRSMARIRPLLPNGPKTQVLLTTRNQDLARSLNAQVWPLQELLPEDGRLLLTSILGGTRTEQEPEAAAEICELLDNHPLAVEITAQRLKSRPRRRLTDMANRLRDEKQRLTLLAISDREVRASFTVSWQALDASHRRVFALLGLFNGRSFTAAAIAHIAELDQYTTEDRLFSLKALSLIQEEGDTRYRQHPLLADFAREQLGQAPSENNSFVTYYLRFAQKFQQNYDALRPEWENMMIAMEIAHNHHNSQSVIDFAHALHEAWFTRGRYTQARQGLSWACENALSQNDLQSLAHLLLLQGQACIKQSDYETANTVLTQSLQIYENQLADNSGVVAVKYELAEIASEQANFQEARNLLEKCLLIRKENEVNNISTADILYKLGGVEYGQGTSKEDDQNAQAYLSEALEIYKAEGNKEGMVRALRKLVSIETTSTKDFTKAESLIEKALQICIEIGDKHEHALLLYNLAGVNLYSFLTNKTNSLGKARENAQLSLDIQTKVGDQRSQAQVHWLLSRIELADENLNAAKQNGQKAKWLVDKINDNSGRIFVRKHLADIFITMNRLTDACEELQEAHKIASSSQHPLIDSINSQIESLQCHSLGTL